MRASALALVIPFLLVACAPELESDGHYGCARRRCPVSAPFCHADRTCWSTPELVDGGAPDAGASEPYAACTDVCADPAELCIVEGDSDLGRVGYCARACVADSDCPAYRGAASWCGPGARCLRGCAGAIDCPFPLECAFGRWSTAAMGSACVTFELSAPGDHYEPCATDGECARPLSCIGGRCLRDCRPLGDPCTLGETCAVAPGGRTACVYDCSDDATFCDGLDAPCASSQCLPTGW